MTLYFPYFPVVNHSLLNYVHYRVVYYGKVWKIYNQSEPPVFAGVLSTCTINRYHIGFFPPYSLGTCKAAKTYQYEEKEKFGLPTVLANCNIFTNQS